MKNQMIIQTPTALTKEPTVYLDCYIGVRF